MPADRTFHVRADHGQDTSPSALTHHRAITRKPGADAPGLRAQQLRLYSTITLSVRVVDPVMRNAYAPFPRPPGTSTPRLAGGSGTVATV